MRTHASVVAALGIATGLIGPAAGQEAADELVQSLRARVADLERHVRSLRAEETDPWSQTRAAEVRALVEEVLLDADTRASLLQGGMTAGWDDGFFLADAERDFLLKIQGLVQTRFVFNSQDESPGDDTRWGFEIPNAKIIFTGHVAEGAWAYVVEGAFDREGGEFFLQNAYVAHPFGESGWTFVAGQLKVPMLRETLIYDGYLQTVERSLVEAEFGAGRTQGVALDYRNEWLHFTTGYTDGHPATGGFNRPALEADTEVALTARAELLLAGEWGPFETMMSPPGEPEDLALMLGGAAHYQNGEYGTAADELEVFQWTVDASAEFGGANLFAALVGRHLEATGLELDQYGLVVQGGYFLTEEWEAFARYEWGDLDFDEADLSLVTVGATRYFAGLAAEWTTDVGYAFNDVAAS